MTQAMPDIRDDKALVPAFVRILAGRWECSYEEAQARILGDLDAPVPTVLENTVALDTKNIDALVSILQQCDKADDTDDRGEAYRLLSDAEMRIDRFNQIVPGVKHRCNLIAAATTRHDAEKEESGAC